MLQIGWGWQHNHRHVPCRDGADAQ